MGKFTFWQVTGNVVGFALTAIGVATIDGRLVVLANAAPAAAPWAILLIGFVIIVAANWGWIRALFRNLTPRWHFTAAFDDVVPFRRTIALTEAAKIARDKTVGSYIADAAERLNPDVLDYFAISFAMPGRGQDPASPGPLTLFGRRYQSSRRVVVPMADRRATHISQHGAVLVEADKTRPLYTDLEILRSEMRTWLRYLMSIKAG